MDILENISGNFVHYVMNCIGGANREIANPEAVPGGRGLPCRRPDARTWCSAQDSSHLSGVDWTAEIKRI
jgi:hypothetical protein